MLYLDGIGFNNAKEIEKLGFCSFYLHNHAKMQLIWSSVHVLWPVWVQIYEVMSFLSKVYTKKMSYRQLADFKLMLFLLKLSY